MNTEKLILKGVEKHFDGQKVLFKIDSLKEHFDGLLIHESDIEEIDGIRYVIAGDVNFYNAITNEVHPKAEEEITNGMTFEEAEKLMDIGEFIALPEWGGFWFKSVRSGEILILTKEGEITNTPFEEFKERNDWAVVDATPEQKVLLDEYWASLEVSVDETEVIEPEVVEPEIVAPEVIVAETPAEIVVIEEVVVPAKAKKSNKQ